MSRNKKRGQTRTRQRIYKAMLKRWGFVPCFVCDQHVPEDKATLEHIIPLSKGGNGVDRNLSISHRRCNRLKGDKIL